MTWNVGRHIGAPARLLVLFVLFSAIPLAALAWLGWHMLGQECGLGTECLEPPAR